ncbi:putative hydrophobic protein (TIGR00341 family) [Algoriphagus ratkowskyi]|uniref:Putative hydrophobic protein (TIGR00341 family) n=1 Tax=Algoriphagus ratkowskyi TaxID=57028 RepID=A0A2W7RJI5_9BACT|nr:TIGR00341 family protein [Algoriphagus ratkowskyi]PZX59176.1 putative hydrophobic protein (TIGR00341 family) [Algoriphagus ratkowskyi]TXD77541.1 TIGR00341 family protein [Algoriphagus ratkowskyi]
MKNITFVYDPETEQEKLEELLERLDPKPVEHISFSDLKISNYSERDCLACSLSDEHLKDLIQSLGENKVKLALLPHPQMIEARKGYGINSNFEKAWEEIQLAEEIPVIDMMQVNEKMAFNSLVVGTSLGILYSSSSSNFFEGLKQRLKQLGSLFRRVKLKPYTITYKNGSDEEKVIETAAMGILAVAHCESNIIFRRVIQESGLEDGRVHLLILAPKSLFSLIQFGLQNLFFPVKGSTLPSFVGYLSTSEVVITSSETIQFAMDGKEGEEKELHINLVEEKIKLLPGASILEAEKTDGPDEINARLLPTGRLKEELLHSYLPWVRHATAEEFKELFSLLRQNAQTSSTYLVLMALSTMIATFGLFGDSAPVVIGAMILAPLMGPIISLAMGALRQDALLIKNSLITIFWGIILGLLFSILITSITPLEILNDQILARIRPNLLDLGIAVASGIAGAYAYSKEEINKTLAGVAISVALVPPLAVAGIGIGWLDWSVFGGAMLLLGTNLAGIVMAASITFLVLGFSPFRLAKRGLMISLGIFIAIALPLGLSFNKMVDENSIIQELAGKEIPHGLLREVKVVQMNPLRLSVTLLSDKVLTENDFEEIKSEIEEEIKQPIELEMTLGISMGESARKVKQEGFKDGIWKSIFN